MAYPTNPIYKLVKNSENKINAAKKQTGNQITVFPFVEGNTDYQAYLEWKAIDGNEPEAAD